MPPDGVVTYGTSWIDAFIMLLLALLITGLVLSYLSEAKAKKKEGPEQQTEAKPESPRRAA